MFNENSSLTVPDLGAPDFPWPVEKHTFMQKLGYRDVCVSIFAALVVGLVLQYFIARLQFGQFDVHSKSSPVPPIYPSFASLLGSTRSFLSHPKKLLYNATTIGDVQRPVHLQLIAGSIYIIQGKKHILSLWKHSAKSSSIALHTFTFRNWFAMPQKTIARYAADNSGFGPQPHPDSDVEPQNRADRLSHLVFKDTLGGPDTAAICGRFALRLSEIISDLDISTDSWTDMADLVRFFQIHMTAANTESLWGSHLIKVSPAFCSDFWDFNSQLHYFSWCLPRWMIPRAYSCRDRLLDAMKQWHLSRASGNVAPWDEDAYDAQYWGSKLMRKWQKTFLQMDDADEDGLASVNLTYSWAANSNVVPSAFWAVLEIFRCPKLLSQVRKRLPSISSTADFMECFSKPNQRALLCADPLLQSVFAETLRLRVHVYMARRFIHNTVDLDGFTIPKDKICLVSSHPAHAHEPAWNTADGKYPLDVFWPYRFLVKPSSTDRATQLSSEAQRESSGEPEDVFSLEGLEGQWIPFGGGPRGCPGKQLAKHHMITTMAAMVTLFDIEILATEKALQMDETKYGAGTLHPKGKVPYRIRRRFAK